MKILVVQDYLRSGGTERQSVLLANAFAAAGHETHLLTFRPGGALGNTVHATVKRTVLQPFDCHLDWFAPGLAGFVRREAPDIVLCMGRMANCYGYAMQLAATRHGLRTQVVTTMRTGKPLPPRYQNSLRLSRQVVANSAEARDTIVARYGVPLEKITVIYNSLVFPAESALHRDEALRARHGASVSTTVLLCVAMFRPEKNQRTLVEIAAGLPAGTDWQLWLAGDGPARKSCEARAAELKVADRVRFLGFQRDPSALYAAADIAVHASSSEALSNFLIEAQAHGLAAVVYDAQGMSECFSPGQTGWTIPREQPQAFREALLRLVREPAEARSARSAAARAFARHTFDPARQVSAYLTLFQELLAQK